ncbi:hypothetical protein FHS85_005153 [Rhodoligotrophos appendicifer]|uniref:hypothetical protein n=1 Tax=Rhodoligotrophos appendicifer TaxID=987056 RepID=UPI0011801079|nr:hypothetical protein [Rhodoligotrophos appendicifer]
MRSDLWPPTWWQQDMGSLWGTYSHERELDRAFEHHRKITDEAMASAELQVRSTGWLLARIVEAERLAAGVFERI